MQIFPAIDIKNGQCVRLLKGDYAATTVYAEDPASQAKAFREAGFGYLHVVDLDGALNGAMVNHDVIARMIATAGIPLQLGGGIRSREAVDMWLDAGVDRVILGTIALKNPDLVRTLALDYPEQIVVGIDARNGMVAVEGWVKDSHMPAIDLARQFEDAGVAAIIYTDISRDGTLAGPNFDETAKLARNVQVPVILSGGIGNMAHLEILKRDYATDIAGVIVGKALYEQRIDVKAAIALMAA